MVDTSNDDEQTDDDRIDMVTNDRGSPTETRSNMTDEHVPDPDDADLENDYDDDAGEEEDEALMQLVDDAPDTDRDEVLAPSVREELDDAAIEEFDVGEINEMLENGSTPQSINESAGTLDGEGEGFTTDDDGDAPEVKANRDSETHLIPDDAEPRVDPEDVDVVGAVDESITSDGLHGPAGEDVQSITAGAPGETDPSVALHARLVRVEENGVDEETGNVELTVVVADGTGATELQTSDGFRFGAALVGDDGPEPGDEVVIDSLRGSTHSMREYGATPDTQITAVESDSAPAGYYLKEESPLEDVEAVYSGSETKAEAWSIIADAILDRHHIAAPYGRDDLLFYIDAGEHVGVWLDGEHGEQLVENIIDSVLPDKHNKSQDRREIKSNVRNRARIDSDEFAEGAPSGQDLRWMVGVDNGVIDLRTGELHEHGPEWRLRSKLPVEYKPDEYDGLGDGLDWFLDSVCKTDEDREMCLAMAAHTLMRNTSIAAAFPIVGPSNSGKSKWHGAIRRLLGSDNVKSVDFAEFASGDGFSTGSVRDVHAVLDDDAASEQLREVAFLRKTTGGEEVTINEKYEKLSDYAPYATVSWLSNDPVILPQKNSGMKSRIYPIVMPHRHTSDDDEHRDKIPEAELHGRIYGDEEIEALLVAAVEKAQEMHETGEVGTERTEDDRWDIYQWWSDTALRFIEECMTEKTGAKVRKDAVYETYVRYCERQGIDPMNKSPFWRSMHSSPHISYSKGKWDGNNRAIEHVMLDGDALDYAPDWVAEHYEDEIETGIKTADPDRVTPIDDLPTGVVPKTEVKVGKAKNIETGKGPARKLRVRDDTGKLDAIAWDDDHDENPLDEVAPGDEIRIEDATLTDGDNGPTIIVDDWADVQLISPGDERARKVTGDDDQTATTEHDDDAEGSDSSDADPEGNSGETVAADAGDGSSQKSRVRSVVETIDRLDSDDGAPSVTQVKGNLKNHGIDPEQAEHDIEKLKQKGVVYEPESESVRVSKPGLSVAEEEGEIA